MERNQKTLLTILWGLAVLSMLGILGTGIWARRHSGASSGVEPLPTLYAAPSFSLTDQNGQTFDNDDVRDKVWIAMVFFTECPGICPAMTSRLAEVQKAIASPDVRMVSFSLDPEKDTPEVMKLYAERFSTDQSRWFFLTGPKDTMYEIARGLKLAAQPAQGGNPIVHTQKVLLIDQSAQVRGIYDTNDDDSMNALARDAQRLISETRDHS